MNFPLYIAKRYLISKKSHNIINIISGISVAGITIGTLALIVILSVFNGFEGLVTSMFNAFNPDILITPENGKNFSIQDFPKEEIKKLEGVVYFTEVIEENVLLQYRDKQYIANIKGVSDDYLKMNHLKNYMLEGEAVLNKNGLHFALIGSGVSYYLDYFQSGAGKAISVFAPGRKEGYNLNFNNAFNNRNILTAGVFSIQQEFDTKYMITDIEFARDLLELDNEISAVELGLEQGSDIEKTKEKIKQILGKGFKIQNRFEQQQLLYKIMKSEKWAIFFILTFILIIATFNVIGSLSMLILDKKKDIQVLKSMGANNRLIKRIFLFEGSLISIIGALFGLFLGGLICWLQLKFGFISLGEPGSSFVVNAYPVKMKIQDFLAVFGTVCFIGIGAAWIPVRQISQKYLDVKLS